MRLRKAAFRGSSFATALVSPSRSTSGPYIVPEVVRVVHLLPAQFVLVLYTHDVTSNSGAEHRLRLTAQEYDTGQDDPAAFEPPAGRTALQAQGAGAGVLFVLNSVAVGLN